MDIANWADALREVVHLLLRTLGIFTSAIGLIASVVGLMKALEEKNDPKWKQDTRLLGDYFIFYRRPKDSIVTAIIRFENERPSLRLWGTHRIPKFWSKKNRTATRLLAPRTYNGLPCPDISTIARSLKVHVFDLLNEPSFTDHMDQIYDIRGYVHFDEGQGQNQKYIFINAKGYTMFENSMHVGFQDTSYDIFITIGIHVDYRGHPSACETVFVRKGLIEESQRCGRFGSFWDTLHDIRRSGDEDDHSQLMNPVSLNPEHVVRTIGRLRRSLGDLKERSKSEYRPYGG